MATHIVRHFFLPPSLPGGLLRREGVGLLRSHSPRWVVHGEGVGEGRRRPLRLSEFRRSGFPLPQPLPTCGHEPSQKWRGEPGTPLIPGCIGARTFPLLSNKSSRPCATHFPDALCPANESIRSTRPGRSGAPLHFPGCLVPGKWGGVGEGKSPWNFPPGPLFAPTDNCLDPIRPRSIRIQHEEFSIRNPQRLDSLFQHLVVA